MGFTGGPGLLSQGENLQNIAEIEKRKNRQRRKFLAEFASASRVVFFNLPNALAL